MFTTKVVSTDPLYAKVNEYLVSVAEVPVLVSSRGDYQRDLSVLKQSVDYGRFSVKIDDGGEKINCSVEHRAPNADGSNSVACFVLTAAEQAINSRIIRLAVNWQPETESHRLLQVFSWENAWHQRQAVWINEDENPSAKQQACIQDADWFFRNPQHYRDLGLPYQRGVLFAGLAGSGKRWVVRHIAHKYRKIMCYFPLTDVTYATLSPALACAPMNAILVIDNIGPFFNGIPMAERGGFLRHLATVFNFAARDPNGLLYYVLAPTNLTSELEKFLLMPHRFQAKFEVSLWDKSEMLQTLQDMMPADASSDVIAELADKLVECQVAPAVLRWNFITQQRRREVKAFNPPSRKSSPRDKSGTPSLDAIIRDIEQMAIAMREEREVIDQTAEMNRAARERLYS
eukprot:gnl/MRDRNA2_/MRDRNA2_138171_c0_seq1.p1 gnl/MRDRNA2_/MRDRNA2_138171_c0~~gnl/MRDRNA2_/MRDRNA2_138171_c0_seq1.p1  ORF type:complete len:425 (-),score=73.55 gnl/MRDRNA2_/MRDRNA2_138171_c0_seq1:120-1322(-)